MKRAVKGLALSALLLWTLALHQYHMGAITPPVVPEGEHGEGRFIPRSEAGINHLILKGTPYTRGLKSGELTKQLLVEQEETLVSQLKGWIPDPLILQFGVLGLATYFYGADEFFEKEDLLEMYGTSKNAPDGYGFLADKFTRQLAYHGLHEVGQMMVDRGIDMGCTVAAVPHEKNWIVGRNFDFEAGRIFDSDKILKWVFPDKGYAHVSVIWAGMVGAVTGVNEKGVYISINAAGSEGFRRIGTPSTLVTYKVLREAADADEAIQILRDSHMFITDIFVVMDAKGRIVRVEKSPQKTEVIEGAAPFVVANHLIGKTFANDETNAGRREELTTIPRETRALELIKAVPASATAAQKTTKMLEILRDKGRDENGKPLHAGHRRAIDGLIATHAVIYDSSRGILYVSQGPSVAGPLFGYDLARSFRDQNPVKMDTLPRDPEVSDAFYDEHKKIHEVLRQTRRLVRKKKCQEAKTMMDGLPENAHALGPFHATLGDTLKCLGDNDAAVEAWRTALNLKPAYGSERRSLEKKLRKDVEYK